MKSKNSASWLCIANSFHQSQCYKVFIFDLKKKERETIPIILQFCWELWPFETEFLVFEVICSFGGWEISQRCKSVWLTSWCLKTHSPTEFKKINFILYTSVWVSFHLDFFLCYYDFWKTSVSFEEILKKKKKNLGVYFKEPPTKLILKCFF